MALEHPRGWYRLELPASGSKRERFSVYLARVNMNAAVYFNGDFVGDGGSFREPIARNWNRPLLFEPRTSFSYSSMGTLLAAEIVERVHELDSSRSWPGRQCHDEACVVSSLSVVCT